MHCQSSMAPPSSALLAHLPGRAEWELAAAEVELEAAAMGLPDGEAQGEAIGAELGDEGADLAMVGEGCIGHGCPGAKGPSGASLEGGECYNGRVRPPVSLDREHPCEELSSYPDCHCEVGRCGS